jgi:membrane protein required for colicin V production
MQSLDIVILLVLAGGLIRGFSTGVVRQVAGIVGIILTFVVAITLMRPVGLVVSASTGIPEGWAPIAGFLVIFLALQIMLFIAVRFIETVVGALRLTVVNRLLGSAFGAFKAALLLSVAFLVLSFAEVPGRESRASSALYGPVASVLPGTWDAVSQHLPEVQRLSERFRQHVEATVDL